MFMKLETQLLAQWLAVPIALLACAGTVRGAVESFEIRNPRDFGYAVGDVFEIRVEVALSAPTELDAASLPEAGRVTRWLELAEPELETRGGLGHSTYALRFRYQIVNAALSVSGAGTPPIAIAIVDGSDRVPLVVPSFGFTVMPVVSDEAAVEGATFKLQPPLPPPLAPTAARWWTSGGLVALIALAGAYLAYLHLALPWLGRVNGPFARALREIGRAGADDKRAALSLHRAFDATAGHAVFAGELDRFFAEHPRYEALREEVAAFYAQSRGAFFGQAAVKGPGAQALGPLCRGLRDLERRAL